MDRSGAGKARQSFRSRITSRDIRSDEVALPGRYERTWVAPYAELQAKMNELRVAIDGAQSTGKTTLWRQLRDHYGTQFDFIPEVSREIVPRFGILSATDWPVLLADRVRLLAFFEAEEQWLIKQERSRRFVTDSSLYAIQAYRSVFHFPINGPILEFPRYDLLLFCALVPFSPDGFRFLEHREHIDVAYRQIVGTRCKEALVILPTEKRLDRAINLIDAALAERSTHDY